MFVQHNAKTLQHVNANIMMTANFDGKSSGFYIIPTILKSRLIHCFMDRLNEID